jgi:hypothetical protein
VQVIIISAESWASITLGLLQDPNQGIIGQVCEHALLEEYAPEGLMLSAVRRMAPSPMQPKNASHLSECEGCKIHTLSATVLG